MSRKRRRPQPQYLPSQMSLQSQCHLAKDERECTLAGQKLHGETNLAPELEMLMRHEEHSQKRLSALEEAFTKLPIQANGPPVELAGSMPLEKQGVPDHEEFSKSDCTLPAYSRREVVGLGVFEALVSPFEGSAFENSRDDHWSMEEQRIELLEESLKSAENYTEENTSWQDNITTGCEDAMWSEQELKYLARYLFCHPHPDERSLDDLSSIILLLSHNIRYSCKLQTQPQQQHSDSLLTKFFFGMGFASQFLSWQSRTVRRNSIRKKQKSATKDKNKPSSTPTSPDTGNPQRPGLDLRRSFDKQSSEQPSPPNSKREIAEAQLPQLNRVRTPPPLPENLAEAYIKLRKTSEAQAVELWQAKKREETMEEQVDSLQTKLSTEVKSIKLENEDLEQRIAGLVQDGYKYADRVAALEIKNQHLVKKVKEANQVLQNGFELLNLTRANADTNESLHRIEIKRLEQEVSNLKQEVSKLKEQLEEAQSHLRRQTSTLAEDLIDLETAANSLSTELSGGVLLPAPQTDTKLQELVQENDILKQKVTERELDTNSLRDEIQAANLKVTGLEKELAAAKCALQNQEAAANTLKTFEKKSEEAKQKTGSYALPALGAMEAPLGTSEQLKQKPHALNDSFPPRTSVEYRRLSYPTLLETQVAVPVEGRRRSRTLTKPKQQGESVRQRPLKPLVNFDDLTNTPAENTLFRAGSTRNTTSQTQVPSMAPQQAEFEAHISSSRTHVARPVSFSPASPTLVMHSAPQRANSTRTSRRHAIYGAQQSMPVIEPDVVYPFGSRGASLLEQSNNERTSNFQVPFRPGLFTSKPEAAEKTSGKDLSSGNHQFGKNATNSAYSAGAFSSPAAVIGTAAEDPFSPVSPRTRRFPGPNRSSIRAEDIKIDENGKRTVTLSNGQTFELFPLETPQPRPMEDTRITANYPDAYAGQMYDEESPTVESLSARKERRSRTHQGNTHAVGEAVVGGVVGETGDGTKLGFF
ncbi:hypothetical protein L228DRAFT_267012 [Xylona heveae TC161]|uniref:Uncharacterized protein n=1 Tax=Xylona heveae (strain CBS 132557 / TC161) TaxID=1328760 RepID=A0A165ICF7_XYLHT|nr:hypothetical protein L228DRAFT_267012 [Xylona heveae TC161]KZF24702.1 hypothetical protein L228DRAFT_267012 [Xylona heveae TC161]